MRNTIKWRDYLTQQLANDKGEALEYHQTAIEEFRNDGDAIVFIIALRTFIASQEKRKDD